MEVKCFELDYKIKESRDLRTILKCNSLSVEDDTVFAVTVKYLPVALLTENLLFKCLCRETAFCVLLVSLCFLFSCFLHLGRLFALQNRCEIFLSKSLF